MKNKENFKTRLVTVPEKALLSLVSLKLKGRVLFPDKIENAKKLLQKTDLKIIK